MRWHAVVTYRSKVGLTQTVHEFEELAELHDIVEHGPNWDCITNIVITIPHPTNPLLTLEAAEKL